MRISESSNTRPSAVFMVLLLMGALAYGGGKDKKSFTPRPATMWEYEEWSVDNQSWSGNEYDVVATVTFTYTNTDSTRTTEMFYDGSNVSPVFSGAPVSFFLRSPHRRMPSSHISCGRGMNSGGCSTLVLGASLPLIVMFLVLPKEYFSY